MRSKYNLASFQGYIPRLLLYEKQGELQAIKKLGVGKAGFETTRQMYMYEFAICP